MQGVKPSKSLFLSDLFSPAQRQNGWLLGLSVFLVTLPVFVQAPLVRHWPWFSVALTGVWWAVGLWGRRSARWQQWGELLLGFSLSWLAGSIYWGWFRWEPFLHLPMEAIGVPVVLWGWRRAWCRVGLGFYLGALLGTVMTDVYFYLVDLIPAWRDLLTVAPSEALVVLRPAIATVQSAWGQGWAIALTLILCIVGIGPLITRTGELRPHMPQWVWSFSGAVLGTLLVDGLFLLVAAWF